MVKGSAWMTAKYYLPHVRGDLHHPLVRLDGRARKRSEQFVFNGVYDLCLIPNDLYRRNSRCDCQADLAL